MEHNPIKGRDERPGLFASVFPREHDFQAMLEAQADRTADGVRLFGAWIRITPLVPPMELDKIEREVDGMRHTMEEKLISSFSTPFDRQDIYSISRQMDYILNSSKDTAREMHAFGVEPDQHIHAMAGYLIEGTVSIARGIHALDSDKSAVEEEIRRARGACNAIEDQYITGMAELLKTGDAMHAMRMREIYFHMRDAGRAMRDTLDILHNAIIDLV